MPRELLPPARSHASAGVTLSRSEAGAPVTLSLPKRPRCVTLSSSKGLRCVTLSLPKGLRCVTLSSSKGRRRSPLFAAVAMLAVAAAPLAAPAGASAGELARAEGTIAISAPEAGRVAPSCAQLVVEARDGLDNHIIGRTDAAQAPDGACRYAISVPAQAAVWLRVRPALVAAERVVNGVSTSDGAPGTGSVGVQRDGRHVSSRAVQIRWTVIAPSTYFFAPNETKTVPLAY